MTWTCKILSFKFLKSPTVLSSYGIYLRTAHDISHGLSKFWSLKFFKSLAILSSLAIYLRAANDVSHGLGKISSLKFLKSPYALSSLGIPQGPSLVWMDRLAKIWNLKFWKEPIDDKFSSLMLMIMIAPWFTSQHWWWLFNGHWTSGSPRS